MNGAILDEEMIIEVDYDQGQRGDFTRNILSNNTKFVSVYDHLDRGTK